ncbi:hypothetical protein Nos7524_2100 [Nostoc sp. PCC 7524]|nr:hypothetical protein Nos7524_2100 [Nostoc sp. PCC 7524]
MEHEIRAILPDTMPKVEKITTSLTSHLPLSLRLGAATLFTLVEESEK